MAPHPARTNAAGLAAITQEITLFFIKTPLRVLSNLLVTYNLIGDRTHFALKTLSADTAIVKNIVNTKHLRKPFVCFLVFLVLFPARFTILQTAITCWILQKA
jgi:hypothetical protein